MKKIKCFFSSLLNMIFKRRVINRLREGGFFMNNIHFIKRKHLFGDTLDPNDRHWTIKVKNISDKTQHVELFGVIKNPYGKSNPKNIKIDVYESSYDAIRSDLSSSIYHLQGIHVFMSNPKQCENPIYLEHFESTGSYMRRVLQLINYREKEAVIPNIIELPDYWMRINKNSVWEFDLLPNSDIIFTLTFFAKINTDRVLFYFGGLYDYYKKTGKDYIIY